MKVVGRPDEDGPATGMRAVHRDEGGPATAMATIPAAALSKT
jgi:hypothetical protein